MALVFEGVVAGYGGVAVVHGVDGVLGKGQVLCLLGANGAGKSTLAKAIAGTIPLRQGTLSLDGVDVSGLSAHRRVRLGIALVPEGRLLFSDLSVRQNLLLGGYTQTKRVRHEQFARVLQLFPALERLLEAQAGTLSGGEQQMLAVGRGLMSRPRYLILDESTLGLAPMMVSVIFTVIEELARSGGIGVLLIEQNATRSLGVSDWVEVLEDGRVVLRGTPEELRLSQIAGSYLGGEV